MPTEHPSQPSTAPDTLAASPGDALERRRLLLKGLGKGSAVVAVLVPIQTLATPFPPAVRLCTVSGVQSNVGSGRTGGTTTNCLGYAPSHFAVLANWPGYVAGPPASGSFLVVGRAAPVTDSSTFASVFGSGSSTTLLNVFTSSAASASEKIWAAALVTSAKKLAMGLGPTAITMPGYFPYTPDEVLALFSSPNKAAAEAFFKDYLQTQA